MRKNLIALAALAAASSILAPPVFAQRGGRGMPRGGYGGGMERGGYGGAGMERGAYGGASMDRGAYGGAGMQRTNPYAAGGMQREAGGFGGGMERPGAYPEGMRTAAPGMGPYHAGAARPGVGAGGVGGPDSGIGVRPGMGAGRPGVGAGGVGGPDSGIGVRPGVGAGRPGVGPGGVGVRPGMDAAAGAYRAPGAYDAAAYGTRYTSDAALAAQRNVVAAGVYPAYTPAAYAAYPNAWQPTNLMNNSLYANPGYGAVAGQVGLPPQPASYDYGANVVSQPNGVYVNGDSAGTPQDYANQAGQIATAGAAQPDPNAQWQPLGVFAMVQGDQTQPNDLFQLAINNQGLIRGNYHNLQSNETTPLAGSVDKQSQRAAWTIGGDKTPIYEAGISNLTKQQTTMLVHTPDGQQKQFNLIRLPDPQPSQAAPAQP